MRMFPTSDFSFRFLLRKKSGNTCEPVTWLGVWDTLVFFSGVKSFLLCAILFATAWSCFASVWERAPHPRLGAGWISVGISDTYTRCSFSHYVMFCLLLLFWFSERAIKAWWSFRYCWRFSVLSLSPSMDRGLGMSFVYVTVLASRRCRSGGEAVLSLR